MSVFKTILLWAVCFGVVFLVFYLSPATFSQGAEKDMVVFFVIFFLVFCEWASCKDKAINRLNDEIDRLKRTLYRHGIEFDDEE